jgi:hypothetical protein
MKPFLAEASEKLAGVVTIASVDCVTNSELCSKNGAKSYPTIKYYADATAKGEEFNGARTTKGIESWCYCVFSFPNLIHLTLMYVLPFLLSI